MFLKEPSYVQIYKHVLLDALYKNHYSFRVKNMMKNRFALNSHNLLSKY
jgi:hypothetical protein